MTDANELQKMLDEAKADEHMAKQAAHVADLEAKEAARRADLPEEDTTLPEGVFDTKDEAIAYVTQARADGKTVNLIYDDNPDEGAFVWEISSMWAEHGPTVWITNVTG